MNFEKQKHDIGNCLDVVNGYINDDELDDAQDMIANIRDLIDNLKPDYPTCITCLHLNLECDARSRGGFVCKKGLNADGDFVHASGYNVRIKNIDNFGCIHHSQLESKNEIS